MLEAKLEIYRIARCILVTTFMACPAYAQTALTIAKDPFAGLEIQNSASEINTISENSNYNQSFFTDNFTFKKELYLQFAYDPQAQANNLNNRLYSRQSVGFEVLKKLSTPTSTVASFDFQGRFVRRDNFVPVIDDQEGKNREGWYPEYHNAYLDLYNVFNPALTDQQRSTAAGHYNIRIGRFYLPFGLNLQTDTHGTVLQLSNDRNFGYERDWYAGFWGSINRDLNYDLYYMLGSGYDPSFKGQDGLVGGRVSLSNVYLNEYGIEGGIALISGQRISDHALERSVVVASKATNGEFIQTKRVGVDARYTHLLASGSLTGTTELSAGKDETENVFTQLYQLSYLHHSRKWEVSSQYRRFYQDFSAIDTHFSNSTDTSVIGELTWYLRNDIGNANLHWIKLNMERQLERMGGRNATVITIQYYYYW